MTDKWTRAQALSELMCAAQIIGGEDGGDLRLALDVSALLGVEYGADIEDLVQRVRDGYDVYRAAIIQRAGGIQ